MAPSSSLCTSHYGNQQEKSRELYYVSTLFTVYEFMLCTTAACYLIRDPYERRPPPRDPYAAPRDPYAAPRDPYAAPRDPYASSYRDRSPIDRRAPIDDYSRRAPASYGAYDLPARDV